MGGMKRKKKLVKFKRNSCKVLGEKSAIKRSERERERERVEELRALMIALSSATSQLVREYIISEKHADEATTVRLTD